MPSDPDLEGARAVARWAGHDLGDAAAAELARYAEWLVAEAIPAGGLGPREGERLWDRHLLDSLAFADAWNEPPTELLDVGSGVGLPGIPLALLWPDCYVTLLDRGRRRVRLAMRATRVIDLPRVRVAQGDVFSVADEWEAVVFRAAVKPMEAVGLASKLLANGGIAVLGLSRRTEEPAEAGSLMAIGEAMGLDMTLRRVPAEVLDGGAWLLIMTRS